MSDLTTSPAVDSFMGAANEAAMRTVLELGTIATQAASAVAITGGTIAGLTSLGITGAAGATSLTVLGGTQTSSFPVADMRQTWNAAGTVFVARTLDVTNTASAANSLLDRWRLDGNTLMDITKTGRLRLGLVGAGIFNAYIESSNNGYLAFTDPEISGSYTTLSATNYLAWTNTLSPTSGTRDTFLGRDLADQAATLRLGRPLAAAWVNQKFGPSGAIIGTTTNGSPTNTLTICGSVSTGTGTGGDIILGVYGTNGVSGTAIGTLNTVVTIVAARKVLNISSIPTSSAGLSAGDVYSNAGILTIV